MKGSSIHFDKILDDVLDGQSLYMGFLNFYKLPRPENHSKDQVTFHKVNRNYVVHKGVPSIEINLTPLMKDLKITPWFVLYLETADGTYAWMRLRRY